MSDQTAPRRQRVAAYAVVVRGNGEDREVLLTRMSSRTHIQGWWTLPGGGVDHGEDPRDTVRREVAEETGLHVEPGAVIDVHSTHFAGPRSDGLVEDYHGIHLVFAAQVLARSAGTAPQVVERDGLTDLAAWVPFKETLGLPLLSAAATVLANLWTGDP